jgi:hypothetical protein
VLRRALVPVIAFVAVVLAACSTEAGSPAGDPGAGGGPATAGDAPEEVVDPMVAEEGLGSCAERFSVRTLSERRFAFDGTVTEIREVAADAPYEVEFAVARWYVGGDGPSAVVRTYNVTGGSLAEDLALAAGGRILASGDDDFLWGCGFSMPFSEENASLFEQAFGV